MATTVIQVHASESNLSILYVFKHDQEETRHFNRISFHLYIISESCMKLLLFSLMIVLAYTVHRMWGWIHCPGSTVTRHLLDKGLSWAPNMYTTKEPNYQVTCASQKRNLIVYMGGICILRWVPIGCGVSHQLQCHFLFVMKIDSCFVRIVHFVGHMEQICPTGRQSLIVFWMGNVLGQLTDVEKMVLYIFG